MRLGEVNVITLGCSKNLVDSEQLLRLFAAAGYRVRHNPKRITGQIVVVNTCGFIAAAQEESINTILSLIEHKKKGRISKLIVMGCLSERFRGDLAGELPEVDAIYGKFDWRKIVTDLGITFHDLNNDRLLSTPHHYAYIKISEGCNQQCSYCAIPIITGRMRSRQMEDIVREVTQLAQQGTSEFLIIAQDLTSYGIDLAGKPLLADLIARLSDIPGVQWIRLHYAYPTHFPYDILPIIRERDNVCKYLDIALQHASDKILKLMHRGITCKETEELLSRIREEVPGIALRTTFIVGHPQETEEDFAQLLSFTERMHFERMGAFAYSHEEGTYSSHHYEDDVPADIKLARLQQLMDLQNQIGNAFSESLINKEEKVIIDRHEENYYIGRSQYDSPEVDPEVIIYDEHCSKRLLTGRYYNCQIIATEDFDLVARPLTIL